MHTENMSDTLYHFTGGRTMYDTDLTALQKDEACYQKLLTVLRSRFIAARGVDGEFQYFNGGVQISIDPDGHLANGDFDGWLVKANYTCYCEIPLSACGRHCNKYGKFGVGFAIQHMAYLGARPVSYVPQINLGQIDAPYKGFALLDNITKNILHNHEVIREWDDVHNPEDVDGYQVCDNPHLLQSVQTLLERDMVVYIKPYDCTLSFDDPENYYTEREWRLFGSTEITPKTVRNIVVAAGYKARLIRDLPEFSAYEIHELGNVVVN